MANIDDKKHVKPGDLFIYATDGQMYLLREKEYMETEASLNPNPTIGDLIAHGTAVAAVPPNAGTACYLINLASFCSDNPAVHLSK